MKALACLIPFLLVACTGYMHEAHNGSNKWERDLLVKIGGTASQRGSDGSSIVTDDQDSFRAGATVAAGGIAAHFNHADTVSNNGVKLGNQRPTITTNKLPDGSTVQTVTYPPPQ